MTEELIEARFWARFGALAALRRFDTDWLLRESPLRFYTTCMLCLEFKSVTMLGWCCFFTQSVSVGLSVLMDFAMAG